MASNAVSANDFADTLYMHLGDNPKRIAIPKAIAARNSKWLRIACEQHGDVVLQLPPDFGSHWTLLNFVQFCHTGQTDIGHGSLGATENYKQAIELYLLAHSLDSQGLKKHCVKVLMKTHQASGAMAPAAADVSRAYRALNASIIEDYGLKRLLADLTASSASCEPLGFVHCGVLPEFVVRLHGASRRRAHSLYDVDRYCEVDARDAGCGEDASGPQWRLEIFDQAEFDNLGLLVYSDLCRVP